MSTSSIVSLTVAVIRAGRVINLIIGALSFALIVASFPGHALIVGRLAAKYRGAIDPEPLVWTLRALGVLAIVGVAIVAAVLRELAQILATTRLGDPFAPDNAARLTTIAWALLAWQLLELLLGGINWWVARLGADASTWTPSLDGWLAVLVTFVLARVFAIGTAMRDDLSGTV